MTRQRYLSVIPAVLLLGVTAVGPVMARGAADPSAQAGSKTIEVFMAPWNTTPIEGRDPYKEWLDSQTGYSWSLTRSTQFTSELTTRAAARRMPDLIVFDDAQTLFSMYDQGILLEDWSPYTSAMPQAMKNMGEMARRYFNRNGKLVAQTTTGGDQFWWFLVRQDWLKNLGLAMPTTIEELLEVGRAFTFNDPDGNGKDDTWGFTSAGENANIGEIRNIAYMFGPRDWYADTAAGKASHPIVDGNYKKTLDFVKAAYDAGTLDPDYYTIGWNDRKPNLYNGRYGVVYYPPEALLSETDAARLDGQVKDWYALLPPIKGTPQGGKLQPLPFYGAIRTASATAGQDPAKMAAIAKVFELCAVPNDGYYIIRGGYQIDNYAMVDFPGGRKYFNLGLDGGVHRAGTQDGQNYGLWNWGKFINDLSLPGIKVEGTTARPDDLVQRGVAMTNEITAWERYPTERFLLSLDAGRVAQTQTVQDEFTIRYILGQTADYDGFVKQWLAAGGQALIDEATAQFKQYGVLR